jgi:hypothetical protein
LIPTTACWVRDRANAPELLGRKLWKFGALNKRKWLILGIAAACVPKRRKNADADTDLYTTTVRPQIDPASNLVSRDNDNNVKPNFIATQGGPSEHHG